MAQEAQNLKDPHNVSPLTLELLTWISSRPRTYAEAMEAWRSACPRHSVWEDASLAGLIEVVNDGRRQNQSRVVVTARGQALLERHR